MNQGAQLTITVGNSECSLTGADTALMQVLRNGLAVRQKTGRYITRGGRRFPEVIVTHLISRKGVFPTGLLYLVEEILTKRGQHFIHNDSRTVPALQKYPSNRFKALYRYPAYPEQEDAARAALEASRGIISAPTGSGKSLICAKIIDAFRVPTLVVVPSLELKAQLTESLGEIFGKKNVGPLGKGKPKCWISVENVAALDTEKVQKGIDLVILDEFHHAAAATYRTLNTVAWSSVYFKIGLTATPFRSSDEERLLLESVLSKVIYRIDYKTAVAKGYIVPLEVYYYDLPVRKDRTVGANYHAAYKKLVVEREDRNELICDLVASLIDSGKSTLVLTKQIDHGKLLQGLLLAKDHNVAFVKGENDDNRETISEFSKSENGALIGTSGVIGEGVDTKSAEYVILAGGGKAKTAFMQQVGRVFRRFGSKESGKVIMFRDASNKWLLEHFETCVEHLAEEYGVVPVCLN